MRHLLFISALFICLHSIGQTNGDNMYRAGTGGRITPGRILDNGESEVETPFFKDNWMQASLMFTNGKSQNGLLVKLNLFENYIHYLDAKGIENINVTPVREVKLVDSVTKNEYIFFHSSAIAATGVEPGWYEVLYNGKTSLYKKTVKKLMGAASLESDDEPKPLSTSVQYHVLTNGNLLQIKKVKDIPEILKTRKEELQNYMQSQKLGGRSESDMIRLVEYYNGLK